MNRTDEAWPWEAIDETDQWVGSYDEWKTRSEPMASIHSAAEEDAREQRWTEFVIACREFAASEPDQFSAVLRAVAEAMKRG